ncbi:MAG: hypothetical protein ACOYOT_03270 [Bacteroidales bacterium]
MAQNLISATLSAADAAEVKQNLSAVAAKLTFLSTLQSADVSGLFKVGNAYLPFIDQIHEVVVTHPEILPAIFDKEEFLRDYDLFSAIRPILNQLNELGEGLQKSYTAAGSDTLVAALEVYSAVKQNKDKVPGLSVVNDNLAIFFKKAKAKPEAQAK